MKNLLREPLLHFLLLGAVLFAADALIANRGECEPAQAKRDVLREYGPLAAQYADEFRAKWMRGRHPEGDPLVGRADIQSLADLAGAHDVLREMRFLPLGRQTIVTLAIVIALPYLPLLLTMIPLEELVARILGKLL